jgi:hypothetical protein
MFAARQKYLAPNPVIFAFDFSSFGSTKRALSSPVHGRGADKMVIVDHC